MITQENSLIPTHQNVIQIQLNGKSARKKLELSSSYSVSVFIQLLAVHCSYTFGKIINSVKQHDNHNLNTG